MTRADEGKVMLSPENTQWADQFASKLSMPRAAFVNLLLDQLRGSGTQIIIGMQIPQAKQSVRVSETVRITIPRRTSWKDVL